MRCRLSLVALVLVVLASCSSGKKASAPPLTSQLPRATTSTVPPTAVTVRVLSPEKSSVQGIGGRGMVIALVFEATDPAKLPAQFRLGGALPSPAPAVKPGHNPAFPGLVVTLSTTSTSLGGPTTNLANLFQIVSPSTQPDGSVRVTAVWTNAQAGFGADLDGTLLALAVAGTAPDALPQNPGDLNPISNLAQVTFRLAGGVVTSEPTTSTTTPKATTTTKAGPTTTTTKVPATTVTTKAPDTTTTAPATTSTTKLLGIFPPGP